MNTTKPNETKACLKCLLCHPARNGSGQFYSSWNLDGTVLGVAHRCKASTPTPLSVCRQ